VCDGPYDEEFGQSGTCPNEAVGENGLILLYTYSPKFAVLQASVSLENTFFNLPGRLSMDL
jgi:hypothetical protein